MTRTSRRRGVALADFMAGSMILAGTLTGVFTLTRVKLEALADGDRSALALASAEAVLDELRASGLPALPSGGADPDGFRRVAQIPLDVPGLIAEVGHIEARALRVSGGATHDLYEARVVVSWNTTSAAPSRLSLTTVVPARTGAR